MNNNAFVGEVSRRLGYEEKDAERILASLFEIITEELQEGNIVELGNLGDFRVEKRIEKIVSDASTGRRFLVPPELQVIFEPGSAWKEETGRRQSDE